MPTVVPMPSIRTWPGVTSRAPAGAGTSRMYRPNIAIRTMLFSTGVHIIAPNLPRALRTCPSMKNSP